jgi:hypothetical protein
VVVKDTENVTQSRHLAFLPKISLKHESEFGDNNPTITVTDTQKTRDQGRQPYTTVLRKDIRIFHNRIILEVENKT